MVITHVSVSWVYHIMGSLVQVQLCTIVNTKPSHIMTVIRILLYRTVPFKGIYQYAAEHCGLVSKMRYMEGIHLRE